MLNSRSICLRKILSSCPPPCPLQQKRLARRAQPAKEMTRQPLQRDDWREPFWMSNTAGAKRYSQATLVWDMEAAAKTVLVIRWAAMTPYRTKVAWRYRASR